MRFRRQGPSLVVDTPAKLNLFLEVRGKRQDGFHELETLMVSIGLFDTLRFSVRSRGIAATSRLDRRLSGQALASDDSNLIVRAAKLLAERSGYSGGAQIDLIKRIPLSAGLGGGSSDAAATLVALNRLWETGLSVAELHELAAELGSDVNFFLASAPLAVCRGRGERVEPLPLPRPLDFVVVRPTCGASTREVFAAWQRCGVMRDVGPMLQTLSSGSLSALGGQLFNALQAPSASLHGDIEDTLTVLSQAGGCGTLMSGSGSTCFAVCSSRRVARRIERRLSVRYPGSVWMTQSAV